MRGLLIGRFQPFHLGHLAVVERIRSQHPDDPLVLGIGSAQESYTISNPFTAGERFEMIDRCLTAARVSGWVAVPVPDIGRHAQWAAYVESLVPPFDRVYTNNPLTRLLFERAGYPVESPELVQRERFEGTKVRALLASGGAWQECVAPTVASYLEHIGGPARLRLLAEHEPGPSAEGRS